jgi:NAD(P)-dependent dehydrogenase (short-subunit alcohol dehydrogenase family)
MSDPQTRNFTVLVTGANRGLGRAIAARFVAGGARVLGTYRRYGGEASIPAGVVPLQVDVASDLLVGEFVAKLDEPIDVLVNNAGAASIARSRRDEPPLAELTRNEFLWLLGVNAVAPLLLTRALLPHLRRGTRRTIVNVSSDLGSIALNDIGGRYAYRSSKAALNMITKSLAIDLAGEGFTCFAWHPGWLRTDMGGPEAPGSAEEAADGLYELLQRPDPARNGGFFDYRGEPLPW